MEEVDRNVVICDDNLQINFNISGHKFVTLVTTLLHYPDTKLGRLATEHHPSHVQDYFFDADDVVFREVLRYYRTGELHIPTGSCNTTFGQQLEFWEISEEKISACCQETGLSEQQLETQFMWFEKGIQSDREVLSLTDHIWYFMTDPNGPYTNYKLASTIWTTFYIFMVIVKAGMAGTVTGEDSITRFNKFSNKTAQSFEEIIHYLVSDEACEALEASIATAESMRVHWASESAITLALIVEIMIRFICCPKKIQFLKSIHMIDLFISILESCSYLLFLYNFLQAKNLSAVQCRNANLLQCIMYLVIHVRIYRVLVFAVVFR